jgi:integrase
MNAQDTLAVLDNNQIVIRQPERLDQNPAAVYLAKLSKRSRRVQMDALNTIADILAPGATYLEIPWHEIGYQHAQAIRAVLDERYSAASANRMLSALRETVKQAWLLGQAPAENYLRVKEVDNVTGSRLPAGRQVTSGEIKALLDACIADDGPAGYRDAAIIAWMVCSGPRRSEIAAADLDDYYPETGQLKIIGKGNKERTNYIVNGTAEAFADWLQIRGSEPGPLFIPIDRHDNIEFRRMSAQAIYNMINRRIEQAGIKDFSPHDLRRTFISNMLEARADIATVAKIVGHSSVETTARYDRRPEQAKKTATQLLTIPYRRRLV